MFGLEYFGGNIWLALERESKACGRTFIVCDMDLGNSFGIGNIGTSVVWILERKGYGRLPRPRVEQAAHQNIPGAQVVIRVHGDQTRK